MGSQAMTDSERSWVALLLETFEDEIDELPVSVSQALALSDDERATMSLEWYDLLIGGLPKLREAVSGGLEIRRYQRIVVKLNEAVPILRAAGVPITRDELHALTLDAAPQQA